MSVDHARADGAADAARGARREYLFADGLRGLAALTVVGYHAWLFTGDYTTAREALPGVDRVVHYGYLAVPVFIVLSGFVLALPVVSRPGLTLPGGTWGYLRRRARRILPPYYAALALTLALRAAVPPLWTEAGTIRADRDITLDGVLAHLALVHSFHEPWAYQVNGPMWSVGTEWWLYFTLPFLLLPVWRRFGPWAATGVATACGIGVGFLTGVALDSAAPWFLGLFAAGCLAAHVAVHHPPRDTRPLWIGAGVVGATFAVWPSLLAEERRLAQTAFGCAVAAVLVALAAASDRGQDTVPLRVLQSRTLTWVGFWSYSIYLIHAPVQSAVTIATNGVAMPHAARFLMMLTVGSGAALAAAWLFHVAVERRFLNGRQRHVTGPSRTGP